MFLQGQDLRSTIAFMEKNRLWISFVSQLNKGRSYSLRTKENSMFEAVHLHQHKNNYPELVIALSHNASP